jgi:hypothetical protein
MERNKYVLAIQFFLAIFALLFQLIGKNGKKQRVLKFQQKPHFKSFFKADSRQLTYEKR